MKTFVKLIGIIIIIILSKLSWPIIYRAAMGNFRSPATVTLVSLFFFQGIIVISIIFWKKLPKILSILSGICLLPLYIALVITVIDILFGSADILYNYILLILLFAEFTLFYYLRYLSCHIKNHTIFIILFIVGIVILFATAQTKISLNKKYYSLYYAERVRHLREGMDIKTVLKIMGPPRRKNNYMQTGRWGTTGGTFMYFGLDYKYLDIVKKYPFFKIKNHPDLAPDEKHILRDQIFLHFELGKLDYIQNDL